MGFGSSEMSDYFAIRPRSVNIVVVSYVAARKMVFDGF